MEYSDPTQVDAAAKVEEDEVLRNGGGTRAAEGHARKKTMERGRMRRRLVVAIYKEGLISGREKRGDQNMVIQLFRRLDSRTGIKIKIR